MVDTVQVPQWLIVIVFTLGMGALLSWATWVTHNCFGVKGLRRELVRLFKAVARMERNTFGDSIVEGGKDNGN